MGPRYSRRSRLTPEELETSPLVTVLVREILAPSRIQPSAVSDKLLFIWIKFQSRLYNKLSFNIVREASSYLDTHPELLIPLNKDVVLFDVSSHHRKKLFSLGEDVLGLNSMGFLVLGHNKILVCGNTSDTTGMVQIETVAYLLDRDGTILQKSTLLISRTLPGMIYDPETDTVYSFGGLELNIINQPIHHCEKLPYNSSLWQPLPNMNRARCEFLPCSHSSLIYLCGSGPNPAIEAYAPLSNTFTLYPQFSLEDDDSPCLSVIQDDTLVVISRFHMYKWSLSSQERTFSLEVPVQAHLYTVVWSICTPVIWEGSIYIAPERISPIPELLCRGIDLTNGSYKEIVTRQ